MSAEAPQIPRIVEGETRNGKASFANKLDSGESLAGSPTITELGTTHLTIANATRSTGTLTINGVEVTSGHALTFKVTGFVANMVYRLRMECATDSTPAQTLRGIARFVVAPST
jgi:hypothetical protein